MLSLVIASAPMWWQTTEKLMEWKTVRLVALKNARELKKKQPLNALKSVEEELKSNKRNKRNITQIEFKNFVDGRRKYTNPKNFTTEEMLKIIRRKKNFISTFKDIEAKRKFDKENEIAKLINLNLFL